MQQKTESGSRIKNATAQSSGVVGEGLHGGYGVKRDGKLALYLIFQELALWMRKIQENVWLQNSGMNLRMRFEATVIHESVRQSGEKEVKKKATE